MGIYIPASYDLPASFYVWQVMYLIVIGQAACRLMFSLLATHPTWRAIDTKWGFWLFGIPAIIGALSCHPLGWLPVGLMFILAKSPLCIAGSFFGLAWTLFSFYGMAMCILRKREL